MPAERLDRIRKPVAVDVEDVVTGMAHNYGRSGPTGRFGLTETSGSGTTITTRGPDGKETTRVEGQPYRVSDCYVGSTKEGVEVEVKELVHTETGTKN